ncbi:MAG: hypothetical protein R3E50_17080 [Halioglobus sp.]
MDLQLENKKSLHNRVNEYLRGKPAAYAAEAPEEASVEAIFDMLQKAEADLKGAQQRVDRLKWELAKAIK